MKKKVLTTLSIVMILGLAALGILAYLSDTDSDVNVMTLGNVDIEQNEYQRVVENGAYKTADVDNQQSYVLEAFEQGKALLPIVGDPSKSGVGYAGWDNTTVRMSQVDSYGGMQVFAGKNAQDKFVVVENTGKSDAYVRTLVAIEVGSTNGDLIGTSYHQTWTKNPIGIIKIDGNNYYVTEYVYAGANGVRHDGGILPAGDIAYPNLSQVYIKSEATNEDCEAIDGNGNGTLDILVFSQAVQAEGFDDATTALETAFPKGDNNANLIDWFKGLEWPGALVENAEELASAIEAGEDVALTEDLAVAYNSIQIPEGQEVTIDLNGNDLKASNSFVAINVKGEETVLNIVGTGREKLEQVPIFVSNGATVNIENADLESDSPIDITGGIVNLVNTNIKTNNVGVNFGKTTIDCVFNMDGGKIVAQNGIRITNQAKGEITINLNAGSIEATKYGVIHEVNKSVGLNIADAFSITAGEYKIYTKWGKLVLNGIETEMQTGYNEW